MKERGQIMLLMLLLLVIAGVASFYTFYSPTDSRLRDEERTIKIMIEAREALIGYAVSSATRPGQLPCPDTNNDGLAEPLVSGNCPSNIGRLPWKTLGLPDIRDESGERFWYAASPDFTRDGTSCVDPNNPVAPCPLNSDSHGTLTVFSQTSATVLNPEAVAIIFAPGGALGSQLRDAANQNNAASYLDTTSGISNASLPQFITAQSSVTLTPTFNDRLVVMDTTHLIPVLEKRVAREVLERLWCYRMATGGKYTGANRSYTNEEDDERYWGWLPLCQAEPQDWEDVGCNVPLWLERNDWWRVLYYAVAPDKTAHCPGGLDCGTLLRVNGVSKDIILITPGPAPAGVTRYSRVFNATDNAYIYARQKDTDPSAQYCLVEPRSPGGTSISANEARDYWRGEALPTAKADFTPERGYLSPNSAANRDFDYDYEYVYPPSPNRLYTCPGTPGIC